MKLIRLKVSHQKLLLNHSIVNIVWIVNHLIKSGIRVTTHDYSKQRNTGGFTLNYYESRLELFEINKRTYTTFQCKANKDKDSATKTISWRIKRGNRLD